MRAAPRLVPRRSGAEVAGELARLRADRDLAVEIARAALALADASGCGPLSTERLRAVLNKLESGRIQ